MDSSAAENSPKTRSRFLLHAMRRNQWARSSSPFLEFLPLKSPSFFQSIFPFSFASLFPFFPSLFTSSLPHVHLPPSPATLTIIVPPFTHLISPPFLPLTPLPLLFSLPPSLAPSLPPSLSPLLLFFFSRSKFACRFKVFSSMSRPCYQT